MVDKLRAMKGFVTIVEKGSLTAAAAVLGISLPSMVRMLAVLERELGVTLLNRTTRRLHLTDDGQRYLDHCRVVLGHVQEAEATLRSSWAAPHGTLTLTASVAFGQAYVAPIVNEFMNLHPGVAVDLLLVNRVANLVEEGLDAAIRIGPLGDSSLVAIPLNRVRRVVCASASYLRRNGTPRHPKDLLAHRCVRFTGLAPRPEWPFRVKSRHVAVPIGSVLTCNQADVAIEACASSVGLGSFLSYMVASLRRSGKLAYVLEDFEIDPLPIHFLYPRSRILSPTVRAFADLCVSRLRHVALE